MHSAELGLSAAFSGEMSQAGDKYQEFYGHQPQLALAPNQTSTTQQVEALSLSGDANPLLHLVQILQTNPLFATTAPELLAALADKAKRTTEQLTQLKEVGYQVTLEHIAAQLLRQYFGAVNTNAPLDIQLLARPVALDLAQQEAASSIMVHAFFTHIALHCERIVKDILITCTAHARQQQNDLRAKKQTIQQTLQSLREYPVANAAIATQQQEDMQYFEGQLGQHNAQLAAINAFLTDTQLLEAHFGLGSRQARQVVQSTPSLTKLDPNLAK